MASLLGGASSGSFPDLDTLPPAIKAVINEAIEKAMGTAVAEIERVRITFAVALGIVVWEILATSHLEYRQIWKKRDKISLVSLFYAINRYFTPISLSISLILLYWPGSMDSCRRIVRWTYVAPLVTYAASAGLLGTRVVAVWQHNRIVLGTLVVLALFTLSVQIAVFSHAQAYEMPSNIKVCLPNADSQEWLWAYFSVVVLYDSVVLVLSLVKTVSIIREGAQSRILQVLVRDQIVFFGMTLLVNVANLVYYGVSDPQRNRSAMCPIAVAVTSIAANRMLLNVRSAADEGQMPLSGSSSFPLSLQKQMGSGLSHTAISIPFPAKERDEVYVGKSSGRSVDTFQTR